MRCAMTRGSMWCARRSGSRHDPNEAFAKLIPIKVAKAAQAQGVVPPALVQMSGE